MYPYDYLSQYDYLCHHGIKGQKWGVRRFQNEDMTWTEAGKKRYGNISNAKRKRIQSKSDKYMNKTRDSLNESSRYQERYVNAYNKTAERLNKEHDQITGIKATKKLFDEVFTEEYNKLLLKDIETSEGFKKTKELMQKYGKESLGEVAKQAINEYEQYKEKYGIKENSSKKEYTKKDQKIDSKWERKGPNSKIEDVFYDIDESDYKSNSEYIKKLTKALNEQASKYGVSPSGKKQIHYTESEVRRNLEEYGNLDGAYEIIDKN